MPSDAVLPTKICPVFQSGDVAPPGLTSPEVVTLCADAGKHSAVEPANINVNIASLLVILLCIVAPTPGLLACLSSSDTALPYSPSLSSLAIHLGRTKTTTGEQDEVVYLTGRPVEALNAWIVAAKVEKGSLFRSIGRWGTVSRRALDPQSINAIIKQHAVMAGLDPTEISAHDLRSGYLTEAANRGIPLPEAMEQSKHRSVQQA
jgi:hypothetical protein